MQEWTSPRFAEIKMDAEIGSYQVDAPPDVSPDGESETRRSPPREHAHSRDE